MFHDIEQLVRLMKVLKPLPTHYQRSLHPCVLAMITYQHQIGDWIGDPEIYIRSIHAYVFEVVEKDPDFFNSVDFKLFNNYYRNTDLINFEGNDCLEAIDEVYHSWFQAKSRQLRNNQN